jgi:hypothetical protein
MTKTPKRSRRSGVTPAAGNGMAAVGGAIATVTSDDFKTPQNQWKRNRR